VSALGGIGGQGGNFTDKRNLVGGTGFTYNSVVIRTGGYGVNGNATRRRYSRGAGRGVDRIFEQFVLLRVRGGAGGTQPRGMSVLRTV
jgi:hypothetical protein